MEVKEAYRLFIKEHPELKVVEAADYDDRYYLFEAVKNINEVDYNDPFYLINKKSGEIRQFSPIKDLKKFHSALRDRPISLEGD